MWRESVPKIVVLFSGGVESTCLLYLYLRGGWLVYPLYVITGFRWEAYELAKAKDLWYTTKKKYKNLMPLRVIRSLNPEKVKDRDHSNRLLIPLRNLNLITSAGNYAHRKGIRNIAIGSLGIYPFYDNNLEYMQDLQRLIGMEIHTPFMGLEKYEVIKRFSKGVPLERTFSCISPRRLKSREIACGNCQKCKEREEAFRYLLP
ncbi:MAG: 7-cyano-7-deazaguanine synthase [Aquificaceae bacterium]